MTIAGVKNANMRLTEAIFLLILAPFNLKASVLNKAEINKGNCNINPLINQEQGITFPWVVCKASEPLKNANAKYLKGD
jgi:hypothetical protein